VKVQLAVGRVHARGSLASGWRVFAHAPSPDATGERDGVVRCMLHGAGPAGRRCNAEGCAKGAVSTSNWCKAHGGGARCSYPECTKAAADSTCTRYVRGPGLPCTAHGGPKRQPVLPPTALPLRRYGAARH
jgi:hypothetical protein